MKNSITHRLAAGNERGAGPYSAYLKLTSAFHSLRTLRPQSWLPAQGPPQQSSYRAGGYHHHWPDFQREHCD